MDSDISPCGTSGKLVVSQIYVDCNWSDQLCPFRSMVKLGLALASSTCQILQPHPPSVWELDIQEKDSLSCRYNQMSIRVCISLAIPNSISIWTCTCTYQYVLYVICTSNSAMMLYMICTQHFRCIKKSFLSVSTGECHQGAPHRTTSGEPFKTWPAPNRT